AGTPGQTAPEPSRDEHTTAGGRSWDAALLPAFEPGRRNRRMVDAVFLLAAAIVIGLTAVIASQTPETDESVAKALMTLFGWAKGLFQATIVALLLMALAVVVDVLWRRRWSLARDLLVVAVLLAGVSLTLGGIVESDWFPLPGGPPSLWGFPHLRLPARNALLPRVLPEP